VVSGTGVTDGVGVAVAVVVDLPGVVRARTRLGPDRSPVGAEY
jgi:hypothetical protein